MERPQGRFPLFEGLLPDIFAITHWAAGIVPTTVGAIRESPLPRDTAETESRDGGMMAVSFPLTLTLSLRERSFSLRVRKFAAIRVYSCVYIRG